MNAETGSSKETAADMAEAARAWLAELDGEQLPFARWGAPGSEHEEERRLWFYTPTDHGGLAFSAQHERQQQRAMQLVGTGLSDAGYALVATIMGAENILDRVEGFTSEFDTRRGRDPSRYYLRVFGDPGDQGTWGWQFGGHHISMNFLIADGEVRSTTPRFFGLDPAVSPLPGGATLDPLRAFEATGRDLVESLSSREREAAMLHDRAPADIIMGNRSEFAEGATMLKLPEIVRRRPGDAELIERLRIGGDARDAIVGYDEHDHARLAITAAPKGVRGADLSQHQKGLLHRLVDTYHDGLPRVLVPAWNIDELHFAWAGPTAIGAPHYYRVQGEELLIEWDNTSRNANHAHGVVRNLADDFGGDLLRWHREKWHDGDHDHHSHPAHHHDHDHDHEKEEHP